ncbi:MGMT family protein [Clostridium sp. AM58-1XD]|uniref:MGMT family protein n=1 Tax=Clostridium sp. AM58-1XD TaxID=2292307 RepID=UPI000E4B1840|nr:MGMT family protein [Clostridium sp. AM58-1XD]RGZ01766.1 cysteine methyltransferase [Clostridium sp. AM58-1XD]
MDFYKDMSIVCSYIPYGKVATYGQIALLCGKPKNARQVGYALRQGLAGDMVPAHRIVNARGILSGAGSFETWDMQKLLLEGEGVEVVRTEEGWRVDLSRFGWKNTMEEALEIRKRFEIKNKSKGRGTG